MDIKRQTFNLKLATKFRLLHVTTHGLSVIGVVWVARTGQYSWLLIALAGYLYAGIFGVNIALHRYFAHRSFKTGPIRDWILLLSSFLPMLGSPAAWGAVHRYHHQQSDTDYDPHSPLKIGKLKSWFTTWPKIELPLSVMRPFYSDKRIMFFHNHYFLLVTTYALFLLAIDWRLVCFWFALPAAGCFHGAAAIAVIPHLSHFGGYRNHEIKDNSHNHFLAWILSLGEGWHNNHHHSPTNYRHGERAWEVDHVAFIIRWFFATDRVIKS